MKTDIKPSDSEIKQAIAKILEESLLKIRLEGALGNHKNCEIQADHVHNLPNLLINYSDELLDFYFNIERKAYISQCHQNYPKSFEEHWEILAKRLK